MQLIFFVLYLPTDFDEKQVIELVVVVSWLLFVVVRFNVISSDINLLFKQSPNSYQDCLFFPCHKLEGGHVPSLALNKIRPCACATNVTSVKRKIKTIVNTIIWTKTSWDPIQTLSNDLLLDNVHEHSFSFCTADNGWLCVFRSWPKKKKHYERTWRLKYVVVLVAFSKYVKRESNEELK